MNRFQQISLEEQELSTTDDPVPGLVQFLAKNPRPTDSELHEWATSNGMSPEHVEENLFALIGSLIKTMYPAATTPDDKFDPEELKRGIEIESEHTDNLFVAKLITKTHLLECKTYNSDLDQMEKKCKD